jgi:thiol-disulfide isomerase/thioredoxin
MAASIAARALIAIIVAGACYGAWKILGLLVLSRAGRQGGGESGLPAGYVSGKPGFLIFGSPHCAPCIHAQKPAASKLVKELGEAIQLLEVDVTREPALAERYGVVSLPTVFLFDASGRPRHVNHGFVSAEELRRQIGPYLA